MKTNLIFSFFAALPLLVFTGCSADNEETAAGTNVSKVTLTASCGLPTTQTDVSVWNGSSTRTGMDRSYNMLWQAGDVINVNGTASTRTTISEAGRMASFDFTTGAATYYAFYPASMVDSYDGATNTFAITLPAEQVYRNTVSFSANVNPAVAVSEHTFLNFSHVCGMLKVPFNVNVPATKARFVSQDKPVSGAATVDPTAKTLTVTGTGMTVDITSLQGLATDTLTWVLPVGTYCKGWRIEFLDDTDKVLTEQVSPVDLVINRGEMKVVNTEIRPRTGIYSAGVYWAPGNLVAPTLTSYAFASAQEVFGDGTSASGYYFCWNTLNSQSTSSSNTGATWLSSTDPCAKVAPLGAWRTPTAAELTALMNLGSVWTMKNTIPGRYFDTYSPPGAGQENSNVFLPAAGSRSSGGTTVSSIGSKGYYWMATPLGTDKAYTLYLSSSNCDVSSAGYIRTLGFSVRCVSGE